MSNFTLITGACGGLGKSFVKLLAKENENLILVGTNKDKLNKLVLEFSENFKNIEVQTFVCNLSIEKDIDSLISFIKENNFTVTKLINNAGVIIEGDLFRFSDEEIINAINVNCIGTLKLTKNIAEIRDKSQKLEILTVASQAAFQPIPHMALYAATKSFLVSMMSALKVEWKDENIVITTLCPSGMATTKEMIDSIKSMGFKGKITTLSTDKVAKSGLMGLKHKKCIVIPGIVNRFAGSLSKFCSTYTLAKTTGKMWKKSQAKRGF